MNPKTMKLAKAAIPLFLILVPFVFSSLFEEIFENTGQLSLMAVLIAFILFAIIFKRSFCGFLCLVGALQRIVGYLGFKLLKRRVIVPVKIDTYLRAVKYVLLLGIVALSIVQGEFLLLVSVDDVFEQYGMLLPGLAWISVVFIFITVIGSFFVDNFFCKYICIQGAIAGIAGRFSPSGIIRSEDKCINCMLCTKACPANLEVHTMKKVKSVECLNCQKCIVACPRKGALSNGIAGIKIPIVVFVIMAGMSYLVLSYLYRFFSEVVP